jgi:DNA N-6-adenine-methyltransferase (Dam)
MALHEQSVGASNEWYTPAYVFDAMECVFDVDVASPGKEKTPWIPAVQFIKSGSLDLEWCGLVWMNPPFGGRNGLIPWLEKFMRHGNGVCLVPDRTSAPWWQQFVRQADLTLFADGKIRFVAGSGQPDKSPAQGTCLWSIGARGGAALRRAEANGLGFLARAAN